MQEEKAALEVLAEELKALKREHAVGLKDLEEAKAALVKQEEAANKLAASLESRLASAMEQVSTSTWVIQIRLFILLRGKSGFYIAYSDSCAAAIN